MRIWDMELIGAKPEPVVTDGLLCWADFADPITVTGSRKEGPTTGTLTDRASGQTLRLANTTNGSKVWFEQSGGFLCLYTVGQDATKQLLPAQEIADCRTVEFVFSGNGTVKYPLWTYSFTVVQQAYSLNRIMVESLQSAWNGLNVQDARIAAPEPVHIVFRLQPTKLGEIFINGSRVKDGLSKAESFSTATLFSIDMELETSASVYPPVRVGSVRLYDRALTNEEIRKNMQYEIDMGRLTV